MFSERVPLAALRRLFGGLVSHSLISGLVLFSHFEMLGFFQKWSWWGIYEAYMAVPVAVLAATIPPIIQPTGPNARPTPTAVYPRAPEEIEPT
jgi:hypothetical protein